MDRVTEFKNYMNSLNVDGDFVDGLLFQLEGENDLQSLIMKIEILHSENININNIKESFIENPLFLIDEPKTIENNITILKKYLNQNDLNISIEMNPEYLTMQDDYLEQNIKMIKLVVSSETFDFLLKAHGEIFTYNTPFLVERLEFFIKNGLKDRIEEFIISKIELFDLDEEEINLKELL